LRHPEREANGNGYKKEDNNVSSVILPVLQSLEVGLELLPEIN
jgi:hypothetical protein